MVAGPGDYRSGLRAVRRAAPGQVILELAGEIDLSNAGALEEELRAAALPGHAVIVDLEHLEFMDLAGLSVIMAADARARADGHRFEVRGGSGQVRRLLSLAGLPPR